MMRSSQDQRRYTSGHGFSTEEDLPLKATASGLILPSMQYHLGSAVAEMSVLAKHSICRIMRSCCDRLTPVRGSTLS